MTMNYFTKFATMMNDKVQFIPHTLLIWQIKVWAVLCVDFVIYFWEAIDSLTMVILYILALEHSSHLSFKATYTLYGEKIDEKYNAAKQTQRFAEIFGPGVTSEELKERNYFSRNHLTPHADFPLSSQQALTYYFQNCVPGKQSMNQGVRNPI